MNIAIIQYNAGNIRSVSHALERLGVQPVITDDLAMIQAADKVIFPGVGEASSAMKYLHKKGLASLIPQLTQPVLGICLGMQLMSSYSEEGNTKCLGIFAQKVKLFPPSSRYKVPHVGWNTIQQLNGALFNGIPEQVYFYFVHSYYLEIGKFTTAKTSHIIPFSAAIQKANFFATQFHPEKSGDWGHNILKNFLDL